MEIEDDPLMSWALMTSNGLKLDVPPLRGLDSLRALPPSS